MQTAEEDHSPIPPLSFYDQNQRVSMMTNSFRISQSNKDFLKQTVDVLKPYWTSDVKWKAIGLLAALLLLLFAVNGLNVAINFVSGAFMTALSSKDQPTFYRMLLTYFCVFVVGTPIVVLYSWVTDKLGLHWRTWLTNHLLDKYLRSRAYYKINHDSAIDNPDERIAQDVRDFTRGALSILLTILSSIVTLLSFIAILWSISKNLVGIVVVYAICGTLATVLLGRRLVGLKFNQLRKEADFRYNLIHVRNNVESIAFYRGEAQESKRISVRFQDAVKNFNALIGWQRNVNFLTTGYNYLVVLIPSLVIAPLYFAGKVPFGAQTQADMAFAQILSALSLVVSSFDEITAFMAQSKRLSSFNLALDTIYDKQESAAGIKTTISPELSLESLSVHTPNNTHVLVKDLSFMLKPGRGMLVTGPSGIGKSSLLRAIGGLWDRGSGDISRPPLTEMLFLPQRPYMVLGSLRSQLLYPHSSNDVTDEKLKQILQTVNLANLVDRVGGLDVEMNWSDLLSLGEQQRLAFARLLLVQPKFAILDEATSALDTANEERLYNLLRRAGTTYISVGHRPTLIQYHDEVIEFKGNGGQWSVTSAVELRQALMERLGNIAMRSNGNRNGDGEKSGVISKSSIMEEQLDCSPND